MSRKEESLVTRERLLQAALENFYQVGFENTSLEKISRDAKVSRGAAYWHFQNKNALFQETLSESLQVIQAEKQAIMEDQTLSFHQKAAQLIYVPTSHQITFKLLQQSIKTLEQNSEFTDLLEAIQASKQRLYQFFLYGLEDENFPSDQAIGLASLLYTYFEGMYASGVPQEILATYTLETIFQNIEIILKQKNN